MLRLAKNCTSMHEQFSLLIWTEAKSQISALGAIDERVEFETAILRVEAESRSRPERSPETFADYVPLRDAIPDFASLLREPVLPPLGSNNVCRGVAPPPSHLIPKKFTK